MAAEPSRYPTRSIPAALALVVVALQIAYPLTAGAARDRLTVVTVLVFAATAVAHAAMTRGPATAARVLLVTAGIGFAVEVLGVRTGVPFGQYAYSHRLGPRLLETPLVVAFAWTMLAWPAALAARRLVRGFLPRVVVGAWALAACDLFLDPQLVAAGAWRWSAPAPHLPRVPHVPLTNYAGWLAVALAMSLLVQRLIGDHDLDDRVPVALYLWLYVGWIVALAGFLDLRAAAAWGAVGMGVTAIPLARRVLR